MRVLITGGLGKVGQEAVKRLVANGHEVKVIGRRPDLEVEGGEYQPCDITDYASLREQVRGIEGIVHLAAIPNPGDETGATIFNINCAGTFNIYQAAAEEGIKRVVSASSINALGFHYSTQPFTLSYFPIDEEHPCQTTDPYSFSKQVMEDTAAYFWRREKISGVCLRLPGVFEMTAEHRVRIAERTAAERQRVEELLALPEKERQRQMREIWEEIERTRSVRLLEQRDRQRRTSQLLGSLRGGITNFWANIDARDSAQALEKGLLADYEGSHPLFVNDSHNRLGIESENLAQLFFPEVTERKQPLRGTETLVSIDRARELLHFEPEFSGK